jgi:pyruvate dehydrogenase E2 component (dihydrolipoamide acetyltransferase)
MDVLMPQLGETVAEGKITKWFKSAGDAVELGDILFEIETDKTSMEVPATLAGMLADIRVPEGAVVPVGAIVAVISDGTTLATTVAPGKVSKEHEAIAASPPAAAGSFDIGIAVPLAASRPVAPLDPFQAVRTPERNYGPARLSTGFYASPLARRLAIEAAIDLTRINASGPHGRILARDVEHVIACGAGRPAVAPVAAGLSAAKVKALYAPDSFEEVGLDNMRRTIAARLVEAKQTVPHFYLTADVVIDRLEAVRAEANADSPTDSNGQPLYKLSLNDYVIKALALALMRVPAANAVWAEDRILRSRAADIGVAVALEGGLITPVIRNANTKSLMVISNEMKELAARARARKLKPEEYQGGVSSVSNLGMYGVREFSAIINPPQSTILAVGAAARRPIETEDGGFRFITQMTVTLSCDHRVVDGALGAELVAAFKRGIEYPIGLMV